MSRSASTTERTEIIYNLLKSYQCRAVFRLSRWTGTAWVLIDDVDGEQGVEWTEEKKRYKYASFGLTPMPGTIDFSILNEGGKYSPGSGTSLANVFDLNTKIKLEAGYRLPVAGGGNILSYSLSDVALFYTKLSGGSVVLDSATPAVADGYFNDIYSDFGDTKYTDGPKYIPAGYFVKTINWGGYKFTDVISFSITANTVNGRVYYRHVNSLVAAKDSGTWTYAGPTVNGTAYFPAKSTGQQYLQVAVFFESTDWISGDAVSALSVHSVNYVEWLYTSVYYLDTPTYNEPISPNIPTLKCSGRDVLKKSLEQDINLESFAGGLSIDAVIKSICDKIGIPYTATSIDDLSAFGDRTIATGNEQTVKAEDFLEKCLQIINQNGKTKYEMYVSYDSTIDDCCLFVKPKPSAYESVFMLSYENYESIGQFRKNYDKLLQRITVVNKDGTLDPEERVFTSSVTTSGNIQFSFSKKTAYVRFKATLNSGTMPTITLKTQTQDSITLTIGAGTFNFTLDIYGSSYSVEPDAWAEWIEATNMLNSYGITEKIENILLESDAEAASVANGLIELYGDPVQEANSIVYPFANLVFEINDISAIWSRYLFLDELYYIVKATHRIDYTSSRSSFNLDDSGKALSDLGDFIYDRQRDTVHGIPMKYDMGYKYDQALGPGAKFEDVDLSVYNAQEYHNVGEC